jgi:hypothetical protein
MQNKIWLSLIALVVVSSCSLPEFRHAVGVDKDAPDEFMVQPREKLIIPTTAIALPEPTKKVDGNIAASEKARESLYGKYDDKDKPKTALEQQIAAKTGADEADASIRRTVDREYKEKTGAFGADRGGLLEAIVDPFGYNAPKDPVVDAKKENKRIKEALAKGEKIDGSKVATKDPRKDKWKSESTIRKEMEQEEKEYLERTQGKTAGEEPAAEDAEEEDDDSWF